MAQRTWQQHSFIDALNRPAPAASPPADAAPIALPSAPISQAQKERAKKRVDNAIVWALVVGEEMPVETIRKLFGNARNKSIFADTITTQINQKDTYWKDVVGALGITKEQKNNIIEYYENKLESKEDIAPHKGGRRRKRKTKKRRRRRKTYPRRRKMRRKKRRTRRGKK